MPRDQDDAVAGQRRRERCGAGHIESPRVAAGPVGRQTGASTDLKLEAKIFPYSRSKGLFAGLELKDVVIKPDTDDMRDV